MHGGARQCCGLGDPEVHDLDRAVVGDDDVTRRNVAVNDTQRSSIQADLFVRVVETCRNTDRDGQRVLDRESVPALGNLLEEMAEVLPVEVLHREVVLAVLAAAVVDLNDIRVVERPGQTRLPQKHLDELIVVRKMRENPFEDDVLLEPFDAGRLGDEQLRHAATRKALHQSISADDCAGLDGGRRRQGPQVTSGSPTTAVTLLRRGDRTQLVHVSTRSEASFARPPRRRWCSGHTAAARRGPNVRPLGSPINAAKGHDASDDATI